MTKVARAMLVATAGLFCVGHGAAAEEADLADLSLEDLLGLEVTSVAKRPQRVEDAAAAVSVITAEDIRRLNATSLPEVLRTVPGVEVARVDGVTHAVAARGFNWWLSSKLLVLLDGRAIYQPSVSGVLWDQHLVPLEDVERIEVVRGPGATMWGANAVNGVINIVTRHAADTQGLLVDMSGDSLGGGRVMLRNGWRIGEGGAGRVYVVANSDPGLSYANGDSINEGVQAVQAGFRYDGALSARDVFTIQGDLHTSDFEYTIQNVLGSPLPSTRGGQAREYNLLGRWVRSLNDTDQLSLQAYYNRLEREQLDFTMDVDIFDIEYSQNMRWAEGNDLQWGLSYRRIEDLIVGRPGVFYNPPARETNWYSAVIQNEFQLIPERFTLTLGSKFEENSVSGFEVQPSVRGVWSLDHGTVWGAVSRAVRTPSRLETALNVGVAVLPPGDPFNPSPLPLTLRLALDEDQSAEDMVAYELGYRRAWGSTISVDIALYRHEYESLMSMGLGPTSFITAPIGPGGAPVPVGIDQPLITENGGSGSITGLELEAVYAVADNVRLTVFGDVRDADLDNGSSAPQFDFLLGVGGVTLDYQVGATLDVDFTDNLDATLFVKRVGDLGNNLGEAYTDIDFNVNWQVRQGVTLSFGGENLGGDRVEFHYPSLYPPGYAEPRFTVALELRH